MKALSVLNLKGGVGKTVTAVNVAAILATDLHKRVLLVDCDSQANATEFFSINPGEHDTTLTHVLLGECEACYSEYVMRTDIKGLDIIPADDGLMDLDMSKIGERINGKVLSDLCSAISEDSAAGEGYDYVIFDCPPAFNAASAAALVASDDVIIPIKLDAFSLRGMANLMRQVTNMRRINPRLRIAGCLITMWRNVQVVREAEKALRSYPGGLPVFKTTIRRTDKIDEMTFERQPIIMYSPRSAAGVDYRRFVAEYVGGVQA